MKPPLFYLALALLLAALTPGARAERADRNKPMNVESDALRYDDLRQLSVFSGNVVLTKGSILIRGAQVEVRQDPEGYQFGRVTAEPGKRAFFRQKREGVDEFMEGEAELIEYDGKADTVKFTRAAVLRRLRGATLADEVTGAFIQYDNTTDVFTVDGGAPRGVAGSGGGRGRVRAVLTPKPEAAPGSGAPASAAAPSATPAPLPALRSTTRLDGERR